MIYQGDLKFDLSDETLAFGVLTTKGLKNFEIFSELIDKWAEILSFDRVRHLQTHCVDLSDNGVVAAIVFDYEHYLNILIFIDPNFLNNATKGELREAAIHECAHMAVRPIHRMSENICPQSREDELSYALESTVQHLTEILLRAKL